MLTLLTIALLILRVALSLILNSIRLTLMASRKGIQWSERYVEKSSTPEKVKNSSKLTTRVTTRSLEYSIRVLEWLIRLLNAVITLLLTSLIAVTILIVFLVIALIVSAIFPFLYLAEEDGGFGATASLSVEERGINGNNTDPHKWDFEVVPFDKVTNIPAWMNKDIYTKGLTKESEYVVRVLNGKFPEEHIMSLFRAGDRLAHGQGKGIDISASGEKGWVTAKWLAANAEKLKITELIYQSTYWSAKEPEKGFQKGILPVHGNVTLDHYNHVHISVNYFAGEGPFYK